jgi:hypothetical protein
MAQIPHLPAMIHAAPDATIRSPGSPESILTGVLWGCFAATVGAVLVTATTVARGPDCGHVDPNLIRTLIGCVVAGSSVALAGVLS